MGNLTFLIPTENFEKNNAKDVEILLRKKFPKYVYLCDTNSIQIRRQKDDSLVTDIYFDDECHLIDKKEDLKELTNICREYKKCPGYKEEIYQNKLKQISDYKEFSKLKLDYKKSISMTYGTRKFNDTWGRERGDIEFFVRDIFKAYIFDEGIHPEFMNPTYVRSKPPKFNYKWYEYLLFPFVFVVFVGYITYDNFRERKRKNKLFGNKKINRPIVPPPPPPRHIDKNTPKP